MDGSDMALVAAGILGAGTAVVHGVLMQRFMVRPFELVLEAQGRTRPSLLRLLPVLMHFSTFVWFLAGAMLVVTALTGTDSLKQTAALAAGTVYAFGVIGNAWATRGRHPGWMLLALACGLIVIGVL
jgi:hypothetical protein